ncbi:ATP-binding cassette domain-containing protein [Myxococcus sp. RHSTA-1-4]|uniref:ATP-binding cassette domain-containing protein n=1 Tax=Myxococcus sp. RHSTA-1-4 TaxID=2874601 RepID=UPI001CBCB0ED|nr:ATP-binding cassette domain-containing protein [Myxococcus sp. RHSTA-1-4]MBZ4418456.1 ATP-binding cassette domain-containing protein [Myxococcus sp. RHSTA-1-4]
MTPALSTLAWPAARLGEALQRLAHHSGMPGRPVSRMPVPDAPLRRGEHPIGPWIESAATFLGFEAEPIGTRYAELPHLLRRAGPALVRLPGEGEPEVLVLLGARRGRLRVLTPLSRVESIEWKSLHGALCQELETPLRPSVDALLEQAQVPARRRDQVRTLLLGERLGTLWLDVGWLLRLPPGRAFRTQLQQARIPGQLALLIAAHVTQYTLGLLAWWLIGKGLLMGRVDRGWLLAWAMLLLTQVPVQMLAQWLSARLSIRGGGLLKQRLLAGALRMDVEQVRGQGAGQLLGRVLEAEAFETLALNGGLAGLLALIELLFAGVVLAVGAGPVPALLLLGWTALTLVGGWRCIQSRQRWNASRVSMTNDLIERMVGHRTRLAQESRERWHEGEDEALEHYQRVSEHLDRREVLLTGLMPRGWLLLGVLGLSLSLALGNGSPVALAVGVGGVLLAYRAFSRLVVGLSALAESGSAWKQLAGLFHAASRTEEAALPVLSAPLPARVEAREGNTVPLRPGMASRAEPEVLLEAQNLVFRYQERGEPVLRGCDLRVHRGEHLLLEGPSGGGKSTLGALLAGLRQPQAGLLLLHGLDRRTLGPDRWRNGVVAAPQFHENHVFSGTLAFNLLMSREWPPRPEDLELATAICQELGLGELLERMPAGIMQIVGETGWQLSHGERSRLFIARALIQQADLLVLDESFAALDPETLRRCYQCVAARVPSLLVIAHP